LVPFLAPAIAGAQTRGELLISEARFSGPTGGHDAYAVLYNPSATGVNLTNYVVVFALSNGDTDVITFPPVVISPGGHFLIVDSGYSLRGSVSPDISASFFAPAIGAQLNFNAATIIDAVGETSAPTGYKSGTGLTPPASTGSKETAFVRKYSAGGPVNTNDNASDFALVATDAKTTNYGTTAVQGAPGPMSRASVTRDTQFMQSALLDSSVSAASAPNRVYDAGTNTLSVRRIIQNTSSTQTIASARIRLTSLTTYGDTTASQALLLAQSSSTQTVSTSHGNVQVNGLTLDQPPAQPIGGGLNSTLTIPLPGGGLAPGASVPVNIQFHVDRRGSFNFGYNVEATPRPTIIVSPTSGSPGTALTVTGGGWPAGDGVTVKIGSGSVCTLTVDGIGNIHGDNPTNGCQVPNVATGSEPLTAVDNSDSSVGATGSSFTVS
jgi:hypothetical protein